MRRLSLPFSYGWLNILNSPLLKRCQFLVDSYTFSLYMILINIGLYEVTGQLRWILYRTARNVKKQWSLLANKETEPSN